MSTFFVCDGCGKKAAEPRDKILQYRLTVAKYSTGAKEDEGIFDLCEPCKEHAVSLMDPRLWPRPAPSE